MKTIKIGDSELEVPTSTEEAMKIFNEQNEQMDNDYNERWKKAYESFSFADLMQGNYVSIDGQIAIVQTIENNKSIFRWIGGASFERPNSEVKPIKLSKELLIKLGVTEDEHSNFKVPIDGVPYKILMAVDEDYFLENYLSPIKFVHELQIVVKLLYKKKLEFTS